MQELPPLVVRAPQAAAEVGVPLTRRQLSDAGGHIPAYQQAGRHVGGGVAGRSWATRNSLVVGTRMG